MSDKFWSDLFDFKRCVNFFGQLELNGFMTFSKSVRRRQRLQKKIDFMLDCFFSKAGFVWKHYKICADLTHISQVVCVFS